jgi:translation initiation factor IF-3
MARSRGLDLVEVAPNVNPPVCRIVDYGKYRYEQSKKDRETRKHQHSNKVKEVQLRPSIDSHDFAVKLNHAIDFLCDENKVKISLRFRGREMAHKEFGFQTIQNFIKDLDPYGQPDAPPKLVGRGLNVMVSPLPRTKRAPNPHRKGDPASQPPGAPSIERAPEPAPKDGFQNNPFSAIDPLSASS